MDGLARSQGSCSDGQGTCSAVNDYAFVFFVSFKTERKNSIRKTYLIGLSARQRHVGDADDREGKSRTHLMFQWCLWKAANRKKKGIQHLPPSAAFSKKGEHFSSWAIWEAGSRVPFCKTRPRTMQWSQGHHGAGSGGEKRGEGKREAGPGLALVARLLTCPASSTKRQSLPVPLAGHPLHKTLHVPEAP